MGRIVTFRVDEELLEAIDCVARHRGLNRSEVIREAIEQYLRGLGEKPPRRPAIHHARPVIVVEV